MPLAAFVILFTTKPVTVPESSAAGVPSSGSDCVMLTTDIRSRDRERKTAGKHFKRSAQMSHYEMLSRFSQKAPGDPLFLN